jgi:hypothetical protein
LHHRLIRAYGHRGNGNAHQRRLLINATPILDNCIASREVLGAVETWQRYIELPDNCFTDGDCLWRLYHGEEVVATYVSDHRPRVVFDKHGVTKNACKLANNLITGRKAIAVVVRFKAINVHITNSKVALAGKLDINGSLDSAVSW